MKTIIYTFITSAFLLSQFTFGQNAPDVNFHFQDELVGCPNSPTINTTYSLSSADNFPWEVGFIMVTFRTNEVVLGVPTVQNIPAGWTADVYKEGMNWNVELVEPTGNGIQVGTNPIDFFDIQFEYLQEGQVYTVTIVEVDLGVNNSLDDEQMHYPQGLQISGWDDCANQVADVYFEWSDITIDQCPNNPVLRTDISLSSLPGETWDNSFVQVVFYQNDANMGVPRPVNVVPGWNTDVYRQGMEWIVELSTPNPTPIISNPTQLFSIEWDYTNPGEAFYVEITDIDLGLNVVHENIFETRARIQSGIQACPCNLKIKNAKATCLIPCQANGQVEFDIEIKNGAGGVLLYSVGGVSATKNVAAGDVSLNGLTLQGVDVNNNMVISAEIVGDNCKDTESLNPVPCGPCYINITKVTTSACDPSNDQYDLTLEVTAFDLCQGFLLVQIDNQTPIATAPLNGKVTVTGLNSDSKQHQVTVYDPTRTNSCASTKGYQAPNPCKLSSTSEYYGDIVDASMAPNPVLSERTVQIRSTEIIDLVRVFDITGKHILSARPSAVDVSLDLHNVQAGMYLVEINQNMNRTTKRLVIRD